MISILQRFLVELFELVNAMSPYLLLGFFFAGVLKVWFPEKWIDRYMGKGNLKSVINTAIIGIPLPLCSCGVLPTGISFYKNGASKGSSVSFLISTPQTGVDSVLVTYSLLGLPFAIARVMVALITGVAGGLLTNLISGENSGPKQEIKQCRTSSTKKNGHSLVRVLKYGFNEFLMDIAKWLIIGILVAAALSTIIPDDFFTMYLKNEALSMFSILLASIPLYLCATASVPIAAVLMMKGLSPGAALILLMAGPATNAATITLIKNVFGNKTLFSYLGSIIGGAVVFGLLINHLLPREWFQMIETSHLHHQHELLPGWFKVFSSAVLVCLIVYGYVRKYLKNKKEQGKAFVNNLSDSRISKADAPVFNVAGISFAGNIKTKTYRVEGMTCSHCKASVEKNLSNIKGVDVVLATPALDKVEVKGVNVEDVEVEKMVSDLGYVFKGEIS